MNELHHTFWEASKKIIYFEKGVIWLENFTFPIWQSIAWTEEPKQHLKQKDRRLTHFGSLWQVNPSNLTFLFDHFHLYSVVLRHMSPVIFLFHAWHMVKGSMVYQVLPMVMNSRNQQFWLSECTCESTSGYSPHFANRKWRFILKPLFILNMWH